MIRDDLSIEIGAFQSYIPVSQLGSRNMQPGRRLTSAAQVVDIGVLVPPYLPLFGKGPGLAPIKLIWEVRVSRNFKGSLKMFEGSFNWI